MRVLVPALAVLCVLALGACTSYEERVANTCARLGAPQGSPDYWPCVQQQEAQDAQSRAMWSGVAVSGFNMASPPQPQGWTATCSTMGGFTNCYGR